MRARTVAQAPIHVYRRVVSPALPARCKYYPSCSAYALQAIGTYGILRGAVLAAWRLLRCNPFSHGGYDPVSAQTLFRPRHSDPSHS
jgi:putative membrane protein insertion efficiency factor